MKKRIFQFVLVFNLSILFSTQAFSAMWDTVKVSCPICEQSNEFMKVSSYGNYVYSMPSRFQYIFWPATDDYSVYCCKKCHYAAFMWDFDSLAIKKNKIDTIRAMLKTIKYPDENIDYSSVTPVKLDIAEKVYSLLDMDDYSWCFFYRVKGYFYGESNQFIEADIARRLAHNLAVKMFNDDKTPGSHKEYMLIAGAMKYFLLDNKGALSDLQLALGLKYSSNPPDEKKDKDYDDYLTALLNEYITLIKSPPPQEEKK